MIKTTNDIKTVKDSVKALFGKRVKVRVNLGRNKYAYFQGKVTGIYPALFTVSPSDNFKGKTTYSYSEMLCGNVLLKALVKPSNSSPKILS